MPETIQVGAKLANMAEAVVVEFELDKDTNEAISRYGEEVVFSRYKASLIIDLQAYMRSHMKGEDPSTQAELQALVDSWTPGTKAKGKSPAEKIRDLLGKLSGEDRAALAEEFGL